MNPMHIDEMRCNKDGICAAECPAMLIRLKDGNGFPEMVPGGEEICIACGHCVAVCPTGALTLDQVPLDQCPEIKKELTIDEQQAVQFLRSRRSIRIYQDKPVEKQKIQRLIEIARYAPSGGNNQQVKWVVVNGKEKLHQLAEMTTDWMRDIVDKHPDKAPAPYSPQRLSLFIAAWDAGYDGILRSAPTLVTAMSPKEAGNGIVDPTIALSYFELAALRLGLGTCWAGLLHRAMLYWEPLKLAMDITEDYPYFYPMMVGYPKFRYYRLPERKAPEIKWK
jgi:nitroreductase/NAD-dependent dihydropyrimidine dehydrogenase PreA subunit